MIFNIANKEPNIVAIDFDRCIVDKEYAGDIFKEILEDDTSSIAEKITWIKDILNARSEFENSTVEDVNVDADKDKVPSWATAFTVIEPDPNPAGMCVNDRDNLAIESLLKIYPGKHIRVESYPVYV